MQGKGNRIDGHKHRRREWGGGTRDTGLSTPRSKWLCGYPQRALSMEGWNRTTVTPSVLHSGVRTLSPGESPQPCSTGVRPNMTDTFCPPGTHRVVDSGNEETGASPPSSLLALCPSPPPCIYNSGRGAAAVNPGPSVHFI